MPVGFARHVSSWKHATAEKLSDSATVSLPMTIGILVQERSDHSLILSVMFGRFLLEELYAALAECNCHFYR